MKILYVIGSLNVGGAESQMVMLATALASRGHHCEVFSLHAHGPLSAKLRNAGVIIHDGKFFYGGTTPQKIISIAFALSKLWFIAVRRRPDVIHAYLPFTNFMGAVAGCAAFVPVVITGRRGLGSHQDRHPVWKWFDRTANAFSTKVTVNSKAVAEDTIRRDNIQRDKLVCIYNGLDFAHLQVESGVRERVRSELGAAPDEFLWVKVANLIPYKGHADLLQAFAGLPDKSAKLILVGEDRGIQAALHMQVKGLGIDARVIFLGRRSDIPQILSAMDGYVMASHEEGFSNAILEAMAAGLPIVATDVGGNREALQDGKLGMLVPAHDTAAMSDAMNRLMTDANYRSQLSEGVARAACELYSVDAMVNAHLNLYQGGH